MRSVEVAHEGGSQRRESKATEVVRVRPCRSSTRARALLLALALGLAERPACSRADAPPLETPYPEWDRGAGDGPSCTVVQDGRSGDHVPYFRWSGDHIAVCDEPARDPGSTCIATAQSICSKTCDPSRPDGSGDLIKCTGLCRCEPTCGGQCSESCCQLAFDLQPTGCNVSRYDCDFQQTFLEKSVCNHTTHLCTCGAGYCGYNISWDGHMECVAGLPAPCMPCPRGSYKPSTSLAACTACDAGYSTLHAGSKSGEDCLPLCPNGTFSANGFEPCTPCGLGTYQPNAGSTWCHECPYGSNTTETRTVSAEGCCRACFGMDSGVPASRGPFWLCLLPLVSLTVGPFVR